MISKGHTSQRSGFLKMKQISPDDAGAADGGYAIASRSNLVVDRVLYSAELLCLTLARGVFDLTGWAAGYIKNGLGETLHRLSFAAAGGAL